MKPLPQSESEMRAEALQLGLQNPSKKLDFSQPRQRLIRFCFSSMAARRSFNHASILMLGLSGHGKSSTINHLLGLDLASTSSHESKTRETCEYVLTTSDPELAVSNLTLGIIDTPGFCDTDGPAQDACNVASIAKFFGAHPKLKGRYPNLILLTIQANDVRISGQQSRFARSLRAIEKLDIVDRKRPNVVVVITFACSLPHKDPQVWNKNVQVKKCEIKKIVWNTWRITVPVVCMENQFEDHQLERVDDQTFLPDGTMQPKQLFEESAQMLEKNRDFLGLMALKRFFSLAKSREKSVSIGFKIDAKIAQKQELDSQELNLMNLFIQDLMSGAKFPEVFTMINQYIENVKDLTDDQRAESLSICSELVEHLGLTTSQDLSSHSIGSLNLIMREKPSKFGAKMLQDIFKLRPENCAIDLSSFSGYDVIKDSHINCKIFDSTVATFMDPITGIRMPKGVTLTTCNNAEMISEHFVNEDDYIGHRLDQLNVMMDVDLRLFNMDCKPGYSTGNRTDRSFLYEKRVFKLSITDLKSLPVSPEFSNVILSNDLPPTYKSSDPQNRQKFQNFFDKWGCFIVGSLFFGGSLEFQFETFPGNGQAEFCQKTQSLLREFFYYLSNGCPLTANVRTVLSFLKQIPKCNLIWNGGNEQYDMSTLEKTSPEQWRLWESSLASFPRPLRSEMSLVSIFEVVELVDPSKVPGCREALSDYLIGKFIMFKRVELYGELALKEQEAMNRVTLRRPQSKESQPKVGGAARFQNPKRVGFVEYTKNEDIAAKAKPDESGCFPGSSTVLVDGSDVPKSLFELKVGDKVLSYDEKKKKLEFSPIYMFAHKVENRKIGFIQICTKAERQICVTPKHLILISSEKGVKFRFAEKIKIGDKIFGLNYNSKLIEDEVVAIGKEEIEGFCAPITANGTIIVEGILASCYAHVKSIGKVSGHTFAHFSLAPFRLSNNFGCSKPFEIHPGEEMPRSVKSTVKVLKNVLK